MAVPLNDVSRRNDYTATASQTTFAYTYWIKDDDDLKVYVNDTLKTKTTDYTVSTTQNVSGGNVVFVSGLTAGDAVAIVYDPVIERLTEFQTSGDFSAADVNLEYTQLTSIAQFLDTQRARSLSIQDSDSTSATITIPAPDNDAGKVVAVKSDGLGFEYTAVTASSNLANHAKEFFNGDNSTTQFTVTAFTIVDADSLDVVVGNATQRPIHDYTVAAQVITFSSAPATGTNNIFVRNLATGASQLAPSTNSVATATIQANAVTGAKIAMGSDAQGDILYYNGTDYARLAAGTSGHFLKTQGAGADPAWAALTDPGWTLLSTVTASASATVDFGSSLITSTYQTYCVIADRMTAATDATATEGYATTDNFSTTISTYGEAGMQAVNTTLSGYGTSGKIPISGSQNIGTGTAEHIDFIFYLFNPADTGDHKNCVWQSRFLNSAGTDCYASGGCRIDGNTAINGIRFQQSSGNVASGTFKLYGIKAS